MGLISRVSSRTYRSGSTQPCFRLNCKANTSLESNPKILTMSRNVLQIDKQLTARVQDTLDVEEDVNEIADYLRETFPRDYARRKVSDFRCIVKKIVEELKKVDAKEKKKLSAALDQAESDMSPKKKANTQNGTADAEEKSPNTSADEDDTNADKENQPPATIQSTVNGKENPN